MVIRATQFKFGNTVNVRLPSRATLNCSRYISYMDCVIELCTFSMYRLIATTVEEEFNVTDNYTEAADIQRLCRIVTYSFFVEGIDNDTNIYYYMKQNALDALAYWVSFTSYFFATIFV